MIKQILFEASQQIQHQKWQVVDDVVMGGRSSGNLTFTKEGNAKFHGAVSLENNGGFSSVRYDFPMVQAQPSDNIRIHLKGDGNYYQFRVKHQRDSRHWYSKRFRTGIEWETLEFALADLSPTFRGKRLELANFDQKSLAQIAFLIANKQEQVFELTIAKIELVP